MNFLPFETSESPALQPVLGGNARRDRTNALRLFPAASRRNLAGR
jgi:hypothetical protein